MTISPPIVISYDNSPTDNTRFFMKTLETHGWKYNIIGNGDKWEGFMTRVKGYYNHLQSLPNNQLVVLSDARDVVCLRSPKAFIDGFRSFGRNMVVSMELFCCGQTNVADDFVGFQCIPLKQYWVYHNIKNIPDRKYVNAGLIAGYVQDIKNWLKWTLDNKYDDDQLALGNYMIQYPERVAADTEAILLHTSTFGVNSGLQYIHIQAKDSPTFAELFGRGAFFLHIPGFQLKGQKVVYDSVCNTINSGVSDSVLRKEYPFKEPAWHGYDGNIV